MRSSPRSIDELRRVCQPPELIGRRSAEHWAGRVYMRRISPYLTWAAVRAHMSANTMTALMVLVGLAAAGAFAVRGAVWAVVGAIGIQLYLLLDCSDGEVARWNGTSSAVGIFLDRLGHYLVEAGIFAALGARAGGWEDPAWLAAGFGLALLHVLGKVETDLVEVSRAKHGLPPAPDEADVAAPRARGLRSLRRLAGLLPVYRLTGAVESSLLIAAVALLGGLRETRWLLLGLLGVAAYVLIGHLVAILASSRLRR